MLTKRILSALLMIGLTLLTVFFKWFFGIVVILLTIGGLYEFFTLIEKKEIPIYKYFGIMTGAVIPASIFFKFELTKNWELLFIVALLTIIFLLQFTRRENSQAVVGISTTLFGILYVSWFFSFLIKIRLLPEGAALLAFVLLVTKAGDIGAFLVGSRWGKHALIARISPGKSVEGAIGGLIFSVLAAIASKVYLPDWPCFSYVNLIATGAFFGMLAQLGDLSESLIKRDCKVKDSGNFLPGLGGVLDMIDSILFTAPAFYFYMSAFIRNA
ncbi:MAG: phosphatidate cytidylyltransferase [Candidatus Omnitrophota bacterium]|nr:phosphatidate cytidylyltransferase [Candidatus Omnitrophota bacterium]